MKRFIIVPRLYQILLFLPFLMIGGRTLVAQQATSPATEGKIKVVKVIDGKTTVEEYDASDLKGENIWIEKSDDGKVRKHVIKVDGDGDAEKVIKLEMVGEDGEEPHVIMIDGGDGEEKEIKIRMRGGEGDGQHMIMLDEEMEELGGDADGKKMVFITKEVEASGAPDGKVKVHTIKVVNGDTVVNTLREEDSGTMIWEEKSETPDGAQIMIMHMDEESVEEDVEVKVVTKGDKDREYKYEVIVVRSCKSVKVEEPAAAELEKLGGQGQSGNSLEVKKLEAFPSPNEGKFTVRFTLMDKITPAQMSIFNLEGQEVYQENFSGSKTYEKQIDLSDVPAGVYLIRILQGEESMTRRLVIE